MSRQMTPQTFMGDHNFWVNDSKKPVQVMRGLFKKAIHRHHLHFNLESSKDSAAITCVSERLLSLLDAF